jgi:hypothetical protein
MDMSSFGIESRRNGVWQREVINGKPMRTATAAEAREHASTYIEFSWRIVEDPGEPNVSLEGDHPSNEFAHLEVTPDAKSAPKSQPDQHQ